MGSRLIHRKKVSRFINTFFITTTTATAAATAGTTKTKTTTTTTW